MYIFQNYPQCQYVAAKSLFEAKEFTESLAILEGPEFDFTLADATSIHNDTAKYCTSTTENIEVLLLHFRTFYFLF